ncbi:TPA: hypothetical protein KDZ08_003283 [Vibrio parahaemolyticus]|uniref:hypothetical protein n=1 Tax=Vibrio parahaemolyticus TaxID=670 RepID=UPI001B82ED5F|nr:hypothetical protein [Vibrio parahaemolyticus]BDP33616.1 hypothetical protein VV208B2_46960 [Vibrio vulnificus]BDP38494.1 hypothetical protein VA208B3_48650 [Vibrio alginolyticus]MCR9821503.1 hypothetical protein [Vibrio parahaemolyticus]HBC3591451.1 hypothetical protein [Vibrio parahaemolyticus]HBC3816625.1 hypothetical protein [Vibrio parahaemolyticus]
MKSSTGNNVVKFNGKFYSRREGSRLTDCCQAYSTFFDDELGVTRRFGKYCTLRA